MLHRAADLHVAGSSLVDGMGHVPVNLFMWYSHVVLHVCVFIWVGGCVWV